VIIGTKTLKGQLRALFTCRAAHSTAVNNLMPLTSTVENAGRTSSYDNLVLDIVFDGTECAQ
jgi:hypothetical protein